MSDMSDAWLLGQLQNSFTGTTGEQTTGGAVTVSFQLFNPANSGKSLIVYSIRYYGGNGNSLHVLTTNASFRNETAVTPVSNLLQSGNTSVAQCCYNKTGTAFAGTRLDAFASSTGTLFNQDLHYYILPAGVAAGLNLFVVTNAAQPFAITFKWREITV